MYADDTSVLLSGDDLNDLTCLLNKELELLFIWLKSNKLSLNTHNTFYLLVHRARIRGNNSVVKINDSVLNRVNNMKYLGVIIDHKLKWCDHISYAKNKVSRGLGIIFKARLVLDQKCLLTLYNSFGFPYLIYCIEIWGTTSQIHLLLLFLAQKKVVRIITFSNYLAHTQALFQSLSILPVDTLFLNQIGIVMYKYCNGLLTNVMNILYVKNKDIHSNNTRSNNLLGIHRGTANFTNLSARVWNVLTRNLNVYVPYHVFKLKLKLYLMNNSLELKYSK